MLNTDSLGGHRLRCGLGTETKKGGGGHRLIRGGVSEFTDTLNTDSSVGWGGVDGMWGVQSHNHIKPNCS